MANSTPDPARAVLGVGWGFPVRVGPEPGVSVLPRRRDHPVTPPTISQSFDDPFGILAALRARQPGYVPEWPFPEKGGGAALIAIATRNLETILPRLERAPDKVRLA